jgi:hypothetical protein
MPRYRLKQKIKFWDKDEFPCKGKIIVRIKDRFEVTVTKKEYNIPDTGIVTIDLEFKWKHSNLTMECYFQDNSNIIMDYKVKWYCDKPTLIPTNVHVFPKL